MRCTDVQWSRPHLPTARKFADFLFVSLYHLLYAGWGTYVLFGGLQLLAAIWVFALLPETRGIPIEQVHFCCYLSFPVLTPSCSLL